MENKNATDEQFEKDPELVELIIKGIQEYYSEGLGLHEQQKEIKEELKK